MCVGSGPLGALLCGIIGILRLKPPWYYILKIYLGALFIELSPEHTKGLEEASELRFLAKDVSSSVNLARRPIAIYTNQVLSTAYLDPTSESRAERNLREESQEGESSAAHQG
jgi:hypothetical protein